MLDASGSSDPDYGIALYEWTQTGGQSVTLSDINAIYPGFTAPAPDPEQEDQQQDQETLTFELTVTDNGGLKSTDTVSIIVEEDDSFCFIKTPEF